MPRTRAVFDGFVRRRDLRRGFDSMTTTWPIAVAGSIPDQPGGAATLRPAGFPRDDENDAAPRARGLPRAAPGARRPGLGGELLRPDEGLAEGRRRRLERPDRGRRRNPRSRLRERRRNAAATRLEHQALHHL